MSSKCFITFLNPIAPTERSGSNPRLLPRCLGSSHASFLRRKVARGQVSAALDVLQQQGHVNEIPNGEERVRAIAKGYVESPQNTLIVSPDNASRRELNVAVRQDLKLIGTLATEDHTFR